MSNRLKHETSPYLLQHKDNPVDWYPWGPEALERARTENKPILLSVGYSACHWCHVMAHESFESPVIANLMNERFINIKVDREERPDLDQVYQNVAQALTGGGGWPLTVFLMPDLKPFYGGTYFPPEDKYGRLGFPRVLIALSEAFRNDPLSVAANAGKLTDVISQLESVSSGEVRSPTLTDLRSAAEGLLKYIDWERGGLEGAPKFPQSMLFSFLWRIGNSSSMERAREATLIALRKMASGGIYDQLGGGFHRYSVDETWSVPHFEKMLYDNALLLGLYSEVLMSEELGSGYDEHDRDLFLRVLEETVEYVLREMTSPEGGFFSAQDADTEGEEGKYFVWCPDDLAKYLTPVEAQVFGLRYGVTEHGNFEHGKTVLFIARELSEVAQQTSISENEIQQYLESAKNKLFAVRNGRIRPGLDNKILTSWNGLMISGLAWAAQALRVFGKAEISIKAHRAAERAFQFLLREVDQEGHLSGTYQGGSKKGNGYLDDYAFMAKAALDLSRFERDSLLSQKYLEQCNRWVSRVVNHFKDPENPGYFFTSDGHEVLIQRPKTISDQAIPSGTAVILECMLALSELGYPYQEEAEFQLSSLFQNTSRGFGMGELLCATLMKVLGPITVSGPDAALLCFEPQVFQNPKEASIEGNVICHQKVCSLPIQEKVDARSALKVKSSRKR